MYMYLGFPEGILDDLYSLVQLMLLQIYEVSAYIMYIHPRTTLEPLNKDTSV